MRKLLFINFIIFSFLYFYIIFFNNGILIFYGDPLDTLLPVYKQILFLLKDFSISLWNNSIGFGATNYVFFFNSILGSIFTYIYVLINKYVLIGQFLFLQQILILILISVFSYKWLNHHTLVKNNAIIGSLIITFSGYVSYWLHFNVFLESYLWAIILLYLVEEVKTGRKKYLFILSVTFFIISNSYSFYMFSWFLIIYQLFLYFKQYNNLNFKHFVSVVFPLIKLYIYGILLSSFVLLPSIDILLSSPRLNIQNINSDLIRMSFSYLYQLITSFYSPVSSDYSTNLFISRIINNNVSLNYYYSFIIFPLLFPLLFFIKNKETKYYLIFYIIYFSGNIFPFLSKLFSGNGDVRWQNGIVFFNALIVVYILDNIKNLNIKSILFTSILNLSLILSFLYFGRNLNLINNSDRWFTYVILLLIFIFVIIYTIIIVFSIKLKKTFHFLIFLIISFEAILSIGSRLYYNFDLRFVRSTDYISKDISVNRAFDYIIDIDKNFYRIDSIVDNPNQPLAFDYSGFTFYSTIYNHDSRAILDNSFGTGWNISNNESKFLFKSLLGSKYYVALNDYVAPYGYDYLETVDNFDIYKNNLVVGLGFASDKLTNYKEIEKSSSFEKEITMLNSIVSDKKTTVTLDDLILPKIIAENVTNIQLTSEEENGYFFIDYSFSNPYTECYLEWYKENNVLNSQVVNEYAYIAIENNLDADRVGVYCTAIYNKNEYPIYSAYFVSNDLIDEIYSSINDKDKFENLIIEEDKIIADINITKDNSIVFSTIAFNKGWKVKIDGIPVETYKVNYSFIGFDISKGQHNIEFVYEQPFLKIGSIISGVTLIFLILEYFYLKKKVIL